jgi:hypothetical protein
MSEKIKYLLGFLLLVGLLVVFFVYNPLQPKLIATEFSGNVVEVNIEESFFLASGFYINDGEIIDGAENPIEVRVLVSNNTMIRREAFRVPDTIQEVFYPDDLEKEESVVDLSTLKTDSETTTIGFLGKAKTNMYESMEFEAQEVIYRAPIFNIPRD